MQGKVIHPRSPDSISHGLDDLVIRRSGDIGGTPCEVCYYKVLG